MLSHRTMCCILFISVTTLYISIIFSESQTKPRILFTHSAFFGLITILSCRAHYLPYFALILLLLMCFTVAIPFWWFLNGQKHAIHFICYRFQQIWRSCCVLKTAATMFAVFVVGDLSERLWYVLIVNLNWQNFNLQQQEQQQQKRVCKWHHEALVIHKKCRIIAKFSAF